MCLLMESESMEMHYYLFLLILFAPLLYCIMIRMSDCTCMASGDRRFLGNFFDLNFISITFKRKSKVFFRYVFSNMLFILKDLVLYFSICDRTQEKGSFGGFR